MPSRCSLDQLILWHTFMNQPKIRVSIVAPAQRYCQRGGHAAAASQLKPEHCGTFESGNIPLNPRNALGFPRFAGDRDAMLSPIKDEIYGAVWRDNVLTAREPLRTLIGLGPKTPNGFWRRAEVARSDQNSSTWRDQSMIHSPLPASTKKRGRASTLSSSIAHFDRCGITLAGQARCRQRARCHFWLSHWP